MQPEYRTGREVLLVCLAVMCASAADQLTINRIELMPNSPEPYVMRNWRRVAQDYDAFVFNFDASGRFLPVSRVDRRGALTSFATVSYVGRDVSKTDGEGINCLAAIVGATLSGIDKSRQNGNNWALGAQKWFVARNGENVYLNGPDQTSGRTFWYELFPNILFYQINYLYPNTGQMERQMDLVAGRWYDAAVGLGGDPKSGTLPDFNHLSFNLQAGRAVDNNRWREPDSSAGIAWLEYMAWIKTRNPKYLIAADWGLEYMNRRQRNVYYEVLLPYGVAAAARANAELGRSYELQKLLNWCFDGDSEPRRGWGAMIGQWGGVDADGLIGSITDGSGYAFAMNTYEQLGALLPVARYDQRFARAIGKWVLNAANGSRFFFANGVDEEHQSCARWAKEYDKNSCLSYEGLRRWKRDAVRASAEQTSAGAIVSGTYKDTWYRSDQREVLQETGDTLSHTWKLELPNVEGRGLRIVSRPACSSGSQNSFQYSWATKQDGPWRRIGEPLRCDGEEASRYARIPDDVSGTLFAKVESTGRGTRSTDRIEVDWLEVQYQTTLGLYAQGDATPGRPPDSVTDFALYGGSHVGILGGTVRTTNVEKILQLNLLKTDYYHDRAYPTFLYYNPYGQAKSVQVDAGAQAKTIYEAVSGRVIANSVRGMARLRIPADSAIIAVLAPADGKLVREGSKTRIDGVVVSYR